MTEKLDLNSPEFRMAIMAKHVRELMEKNDALEQQLAEAEKVIEFYGERNNWAGYETLMDYTKCNQRIAFSDCAPLFEDDNVKYGGGKAREYFAKKGSNEQRTSAQALSQTKT